MDDGGLQRAAGKRYWRACKRYQRAVGKNLEGIKLGIGSRVQILAIRRNGHSRKPVQTVAHECDLDCAEVASREVGGIDLDRSDYCVSHVEEIAAGVKNGGRWVLQRSAKWRFAEIGHHTAARV